MVHHIKRQSRALPSFRRHGLSAIIFLGLIVLGAYVWANLQKDKVKEFAAVGSEIDLPEIVETDLTPGAAPLPDLLEPDNIPMDANPTEIIDLLGAPQSDPNPNSGPRPPQPTQSAALGSSPQTILIDGSPIPGANTITNRSKPLIRAPIQGLSRTTPFGAVPFPASDGRKVFTSYAKPFTSVSGKTYISIVVGGLGINQVITRRAISELPGEVTLSFAAEAPNLQMWIHQARARGHEVMIELPMENTDYNPAASGATYTLKTSGDDATNIRNLDYLMGKAQGYFAVTNYGGERLVTNEKPLKPIFAHLGNAGLGFLYDGSTPTPNLNRLGNSQGLPTVTAQTLLDEKIQNRSAVRAMISSLQPGQNAKIPIGMGFAYPSTLDGIKDWVKGKPSHIELAPASFAMTQNK